MFAFSAYNSAWVTQCMMGNTANWLGNLLVGALLFHCGIHLSGQYSEWILTFTRNSTVYILYRDSGGQWRTQSKWFSESKRRGFICVSLSERSKSAAHQARVQCGEKSHNQEKKKKKKKNMIKFANIVSALLIRPDIFSAAAAAAHGSLRENAWWDFSGLFDLNTKLLAWWLPGFRENNNNEKKNKQRFIHFFLRFSMMTSSRLFIFMWHFEELSIWHKSFRKILPLSSSRSQITEWSRYLGSTCCPST